MTSLAAKCWPVHGVRTGSGVIVQCDCDFHIFRYESVFIETTAATGTKYGWKGISCEE